VNYKKEQEIETAEMKFLKSVAGYKRRDQARNTRIKEELNAYNISNNILKSRSQWKYHILRMEDRRILKKTLTYQPLRRGPRVKMEQPIYISR
jgi:hypothetical protein